MEAKIATIKTLDSGEGAQKRKRFKKNTLPTQNQLQSKIMNFVRKITNNNRIYVILILLNNVLEILPNSIRQQKKCKNSGKIHDLPFVNDMIILRIKCICIKMYS